MEGLSVEGRGPVGGIAVKPSSPPPPPPPPPPSPRELSRIVSRWSSYQLKTKMNQVKFAPVNFWPQRRKRSSLIEDAVKHSVTFCTHVADRRARTHKRARC